MSVLADRRADVDEEPPAGPPPRSSAGWPRWVAAFAAAWLLPLLTHLVHADVVLPLVIWAGTASLLRGGRGLLDRLVLAAALLTGAIAMFGVLFSVWPWGLHPVPVAGLFLTLLVAASLVTGRRPSLPRRVDLSDGLLLAATVGVTALAFRPLLHGSAVARYRPLTLGEDLSRHFTMFDSIRAFGGYLAFNRDEAAVTLQSGFETYPQGSHLGLALLDNFVRSDTAAGDARVSYDHYMVLYTLTFVAVIFAIMWAMRWIGGQPLRGWVLLPLAAVAASYYFFGDGITTLLYGFASQIAASALLALLVAVTCRPVRDWREQIVLVTALLVALSTTYYLFLFGVFPVLAYWAWRHRRQLWRYRWWTLGAIVVGGPAASFAPLSNWARANSPGQLTGSGGIIAVNRHLLAPLLILVVAALLTRYARRTPAWHMLGAWVASVGGTAALIFVYVGRKTSGPSYYSEKLLHQLIIVALIAVAAAPLLARTPGVSRSRRDWYARVAGPVAVALLISVGLAFLSRPWNRPVSWGRSWIQQTIGYPQYGPMLYRVLDQHPNPPDTITIILLDKAEEQYESELAATPRGKAVQRYDWLTSYHCTLWYSVLSRNYGQAWEGWIWTFRSDHSANEIERYVRGESLPVRIVTNKRSVIDAVALVNRRSPDVRVTAVFMEHVLGPAPAGS